MMEKVNKHSRLIVALVLLIMTVVGLLVASDYGMSWDETLEMQTLGSDVREYIGLVSGTKSEPKQFANGLAIQDVKVNPDVDHGQSIYYPAAPLLFAHLGTDADRTVMVVWHIYTFLIFMAGVICLYFILKFLTGDWKYGLAASLFLYLSPRFFAEGHYNTKDVITMSLIIVCFWFATRFIEKKTYRYAALFAAVGAIAANMRIIGIFFFGLTGLLYLVCLFVQKQWSRKTVLSGVIALLTFAAVYYVLTPAAWTAPVKFLQYTFGRSSNFSDWPGTVFFMGKIYRPVPSYYIPVMYAITTPVLIVALTVVGHFTAVGKICTTKVKEIFAGTAKYYILALVFVWIPLGFAIIKTPILYNSWRHFYFINGLLIILAVGGLKSIMDHANLPWKRILAGLVALQLCWSVVLIAANHPDEFVYYNFLAGTHPAQRFEMDYWNVSGAQCLMELVDKVDSPDVIRIAAVDFYSSDGLQKAYDVLPSAYKDRIHVMKFFAGIPATNEDYLFVNPITSYSLPDLASMYPKAVSVNAFGSDIMVVYQVKQTA